MFEPLNIQVAAFSRINDENNPAPMLHHQKNHHQIDKNLKNQSLNKSSDSSYCCTVLGNHNPKLIPNVRSVLVAPMNIKKKPISFSTAKSKKAQIEACKLEVKTQKIGSVQGHSIHRRVSSESDQKKSMNTKESLAGSMVSIKHLSETCVCIEDMEGNQNRNDRSGQINAIPSLRSTLISLKQEKKPVDLATLIRDLNDICAKDNLTLSSSYIMKTAPLQQQQHQQQQYQFSSNKEQNKQHQLIESASNSSFSKEELCLSNDLNHQFKTEINKDDDFSSHNHSTKSSLIKTRSCHSNGENYKNRTPLQNQSENYRNSLHQPKKFQLGTPSNGAIQNLKLKLAINPCNESVWGYKNYISSENVSGQKINTDQDSNQRFSRKRESDSFEMNAIHSFESQQKIITQNCSHSLKNSNTLNHSCLTPNKESNQKFKNKNNMYDGESKQSINSRNYSTLSAQSNRGDALQQSQVQWTQKLEYQSERRRNMLRKMCNFNQIARGKYCFHKLNKQKKELNNISNVLYNSLLENYEIDPSLQSKSISSNWYSSQNKPIVNKTGSSPIRQRAYDEEENDSPDFNYMRKYYNEKYGTKLKKFEIEKQQQQQLNIKIGIPTPQKRNYSTAKKQPHSTINYTTTSHPSSTIRDGHSQRFEFYMNDNLDPLLSQRQNDQGFGINLHPIINEFDSAKDQFVIPINESSITTATNQGQQNIVTPPPSNQIKQKKQTGKKHKIFDLEILPWDSSDNK